MVNVVDLIFMPLNYIDLYYLSIPVLLKLNCCRGEHLFTMGILFIPDLSHSDGIKKCLIGTSGKTEIIQFNLITDETSEAKRRGGMCPKFTQLVSKKAS